MLQSGFSERMTGAELRAAREILGFSLAEAARYLTGARRSWRDIEDGKYGVNSQIQMIIKELLSKRNDLIKQHIDFFNKNGMSVAVYYLDEEDCSGILNLKLNQSVARYLAFDYGCHLILFKKQEFLEYCEHNNFCDSFQSRLFWANHVFQSLKS